MAVARRGFTLLEIMIVVVIMLGIAGVVLPLAVGDSRRAGFREAREQMEAMMLSARSDAQRTGRVLRVIAERSAADGRWVLREEEVASAASLREVGGERGERAREVQRVALPASVRIARTEEGAWGDALSADGSDGEGVERGEPAEWGVDEFAGLEGQERGVNVSVQVAVFLPDGQIAASEPLYLCSGDGSDGGAVMVGRVSVNSWTGVLTVVELSRAEIEQGEAGGESGAE